MVFCLGRRTLAMMRFADWLWLGRGFLMLLRLLSAAPAASSSPLLLFAAIEVSTPVLKWLLLQKESQCEPR